MSDSRPASDAPRPTLEELIAAAKDDECEDYTKGTCATWTKYRPEEWCSSCYARELAKALAASTAETQRLREALTKLADHWTFDEMLNRTPADAELQCAEELRAALRPVSSPEERSRRTTQEQDLARVEGDFVATVGFECSIDGGYRFEAVELFDTQTCQSFTVTTQPGVYLAQVDGCTNVRPRTPSWTRGYPEISVSVSREEWPPSCHSRP